MSEAFLRVMRPHDRELRQRYLQNQQEFVRQQAQEILDLKLLGELGEQARTLGELDASQQYLEHALQVAREHGDLARIVANLIRLGTTLQYLNRHAEGEALLREALTLSDQPASCHYHDFALQHLGKLLVESGALIEAQSLFKQALILRRQKGDAGLIASTEQALDSLAARQSEHAKPDTSTGSA